jgi:hypothetical protein
MKLKSQPRLNSGRRIPRYASMHPAVKHGLESIARSERRSVSWVIHEIVADYFKLDIMGKKR